MGEGGLWLPCAGPTRAEARTYAYFAAGRAQLRLGSRGSISVRSRVHPESLPESLAIEAAWTDGTDQQVLVAHASYPRLGPAGQGYGMLRLSLTGALSASAAADQRRGRMQVERSAATWTSETCFDPAVPFDWSVMWGFRFQFMAWSAHLTGPLALGVVDPTPTAPFDDRCVVSRVSTAESQELVAMPTGQRYVDCWRIVAHGTDGQEVATIGKGGEGLLRYDMNLTDSGLLIAVVG